MAIESRLTGDYSTGLTKSWSFELRARAAAAVVVGGEAEIGCSMPMTPSWTTALLEQLKDNAIRILGRKWHKRQVRWDDQEWDLLEHHSRTYDTQSLMVSCGTVTLDRAECADRKVLLIWNKNTRAVSSIGVVLEPNPNVMLPLLAQWQLPKGRKNVHEDFAAAAIRETAEETGIAVRPLYLRFCTRLTLPEIGEDQTAQRLRRQSPGCIKSGSTTDDDGIVSLLNKDMFFISQYPDPATGAMRHIYWYAARPLGGIVSDASLLGVEDGNVMTAQWFSAAEAVNRLRMSVERKAVALAVHYAQQMSDEEWQYSLGL